MNYVFLNTEEAEIVLERLDSLNTNPYEVNWMVYMLLLRCGKYEEIKLIFEAKKNPLQPNFN